MSAELERLKTALARQGDRIDRTLIAGHAIAHIERLQAALAECADGLHWQAWMLFREHGHDSESATELAEAVVAPYRELLK